MKTDKLWKWITILATVVGLITGGIALYDYTTTKERDVIIERRDGSLTIEQTVDPETLRKHRSGDGTTVLEKRVIIPPKEGEDGPE